MTLFNWRSCVSRTVILFFVAATAAHAQTIPGGWTAADVGSPALRGSASYESGAFTISGAGADIWGRADQFMFVHRQMTGDGTIVARVASVQDTHDWAKAGVMIRESLAPGARNAYALISAARGVAFQRRRTAGGTSVSTIVAGSAPGWVRIQRRGSSLTASTSTDGMTWSTIANDTIDLPATLYVGIAVTSHNASALSAAAVSDVVVSAGQAPEWTSSEIGRSSLSGTTNIASGIFTVEGGGKDIWGTSDQFRFVHRQVSGDADLVARVAAVENIDSWTKAGIMIRASLDANAAHASLFVSAGKGVAFQRRPSAGGSSVHTAGGGRTAPWWIKLSRRGSLVTASQSFDGVAWSVVGTQTLALPGSVYVGLAVTSHDSSSVATAVFDGVAIEASSQSHDAVQPAPVEPEPVQPVNQHPLVSLADPEEGAIFRAPASLTLTATASDADGSIAKVEFYAGTTLIGSDATAPYATAWNDVAAGTYSLIAVAYDNAGGMTTSAARPVVVEQIPVLNTAVFAPAADAAYNVYRYLLEFFPSGADPETATPIAVVDIGLPPVVDGESRADVSQTMATLPPGSYFATVTAVGAGGTTRGAQSVVFLR